jgi:hypothetical protein
MRRLAALLAVLAACGEPGGSQPPPTDAFYRPSGLALAARDGGGTTLLVASGNSDLRYGPELGSTLIAVDPVASLGVPAGSLAPLAAELVGSYTGPLAVADAASCPGLAVPQALVASRYGRALHQLPLDGRGAPLPCGSTACARALDEDLLDPFALGLACRADGTRRTAFVSYLRSPRIGSVPAGIAWLSEVDLEDASRPLRTIALGPGPVNDMAYDAATDRLYAVGRYAAQLAPLYVLDLRACRPGDDCAEAGLHALDLYQYLRGAELQGIALSNPVAGVPRRAYVSARLYDADVAAAIGGRPGYDVGGALLVVELGEDPSGAPRARLVRAVEVAQGAGQVRVLPPRPGRPDLVAVSSAAAGTVTVYDDETGAVAHVTALDPATGAPLAEQAPYALAVEDGGEVATVYVASAERSSVSLLDVPLAQPGLAGLRRGPGGAPLRIGEVP